MISEHAERRHIGTIIEHGIPIPPYEKEPIEQRYPELLVLDVGDSFVIENAPLSTHVSVAVFSIKSGQRHELRKVEGKSDDYRVWRVK